MAIIRVKLVDWRARLLVKGLKINAVKTKLVVGGGVVSDLDAWPSGVYSKDN